MFNLDRLDDAVLERQALANLFAGFITSDASVNGDEGDAVGDLITGEDADGAAIGGLEPGTLQELPPGRKIDFANPPSAGSDYAEFLRGHLLAICASQDVPYEVLTGDLRNVSDRALRLILNEFRRVIEQDQWLYMIPMFCQKVRDAFIDQAVLAGLLKVPRYAALRDDVTETLWVPEGWPWSHPVQDVTSELKAVRAGFKSRSKVVLGAGEDPEQVDAEQALDNERADAAGLRYDSDPRRTNASGARQDDKPGAPGANNDEGNDDDE